MKGFLDDYYRPIPPCAKEGEDEKEEEKEEEDEGEEGKQY